MTEAIGEAQAQRNFAIDIIDMSEETDSVRSPGWYVGRCSRCAWYATGYEPNVDEAGFDHAMTHWPDTPKRS